MEINSGIKSYKDLIVWQRAIELVSEIYKLTDNYPKTEIFGLTSQMRRAAVSIPSNIAEGKSRGTQKDYRNFLITAFASGVELETQIIISKKLFFNKNLYFIEVDNLLNEVMRMLSVLIRNLST